VFLQCYYNGCSSYGIPWSKMCLIVTGHVDAVQFSSSTENALLGYQNCLYSLLTVDSAFSSAFVWRIRPTKHDAGAYRRLDVFSETPSYLSSSHNHPPKFPALYLHATRPSSTSRTSGPSFHTGPEDAKALYLQGLVALSCMRSTTAHT
jgi:hypothetical protein